jgi:predicted transcriptional regulator
VRQSLQGRKPKLPPETVQALLVWAALGRTVGQVARNLGVSPTTVRRYLDQRHKRKVA